MGVCDTLHSIVSLYGVHMSTSPYNSTLYKCEVCNEMFNTQQEIESHNKEKHRNCWTEGERAEQSSAE